MTNVLNALKWRIDGSYDSNGPVTEDSPIRARNRAKYEVWKYNTFGPGRTVFHRNLAYEIIDSGELQDNPPHVNNPYYLAALAEVIAEMDGHAYVALLTPVGTLVTDDLVQKLEESALERVVEYLVSDVSSRKENKEFLREMLERLKQAN